MIDTYNPLEKTPYTHVPDEFLRTEVIDSCVNILTNPNIPPNQLDLALEEILNKVYTSLEKRKYLILEEHEKLTKQLNIMSNYLQKLKIQLEPNILDSALTIKHESR